jgi:transcriptional regulator with XRE-family HTH domain
MVFVAKKVELPSFGEKLKRARQEAGLSIQKVAQLLNVPIRYLERMEDGNLENLPADVYNRGLLKKYAKILNVDNEILLGEYENEAKINRHLDKAVSRRPAKQFYSSRFVLTSRSFGWLFGGLVLLLIVGYFFYQLQFLLSPPKLVIFEPPQDFLTENKNVTLRGQTETGAQLTINSQQTYIDEKGNFNAPLELNQGLNSIKIEATNKFGKSTSVVWQIMLK